jgi:hypothetical protein
LGVPCGEQDDTPEEEAARRAIESLQPNIVLTGTSMGSFLERHLWRDAARRGIPSAAILDAWIHAGVRFTWSDFAGIPVANPTAFGEIRPDAVFCPDPGMAKAVRDTVGNIALVLATGHPWIEHCQARFSAAPRSSGGARRILFLSEPIHEDFGRALWGFDQTDVLRMLVDLLRGEIVEGMAELVVRPHPRESRARLEVLLADLPASGWRWGDEGEALLQAAAADIVCGVSTMALLEAWACGIPVVGIFPGRGASPFLPDRMGWSPAVRDAEALAFAMETGLRRTARIVPTEFIHAGACDRILAALADLVGAPGHAVPNGSIVPGNVVDLGEPETSTSNIPEIIP